MKFNDSFVRALGIACIGLVMSMPLGAQTWPQKPIRLVVPFPAGTPGDMLARLIQPDLQQTLGQPVIVENKSGAGGNLGVQEVARSKDNHTFLVGPDTLLTVNPHIYRNLAFAPMEDLVPLTLLAGFSQMLVCNPSAHVHTLAQWLEKSRIEALNYASGGAGTPGHLVTEMLLSRTGAKMTHVPYRGPGPALQDVVGGQIPCAFLTASAAAPQVKSGRLVAVAVSGAERSPGSPSVPTVAESGVTGFDASFFVILAAPRQTPVQIMDKLQRAAMHALQGSKIRERLRAADLNVVANSQADAQARVAADSVQWGKIASQIGLHLD